MPRLPKNTNPGLRLHKTGQAVVTLKDSNGKWKDIYCGVFGSKAAERKYNATLSAWLANDRRLPATPIKDESPREIDKREGDGLLIAELCHAYLKDQKIYFSGGVDDALLEEKIKPDRSFERIKAIAKLLSEYYGDKLVTEFGPLKLKEFRDRLENDPSKSRAYINELIADTRRMFLWGVGCEMVKSDHHQSLLALPPLRRGRTKAREGKSVQTIDNAIVEQTIKHLSQTVADMVRLQMLCGARPGEIVLVRPRDVNTTGKTWTFKPLKHKTESHGVTRTIYFYAPAQKILAPYLKRDPESFCFSPAEAQAARLAEMHKQRRTPMNEGNKPGTNKRAKPKHKPGNCYTAVSYARAIARGCARAFPAPKGLNAAGVKAWNKKHCWQPNRLRHNFATFVEEFFDIELSSMYLDHTDVKTTRKYAKAKAAKIAAAEAQMNKLLGKLVVN